MSDQEKEPVVISCGAAAGKRFPADMDDDDVEEDVTMEGYLKLLDSPVKKEIEKSLMAIIEKHDLNLVWDRELLEHGAIKTVMTGTAVKQAESPGVRVMVMAYFFPEKAKA